MNRTTRTIATVTAALVCTAALAAPFTPGDILLSQSFGAWAPGSISEYTPSGTLVQSIGVPLLPGQTFGDDINRGIAVDAKGRLLLYNGSGVAGLSVYDPTTSHWTSTEIQDMSVLSNLSFGKIATTGNYAFLPAHNLDGNDSSGIIRFDTSSNTWTSFGVVTTNQTGGSIDLKMGPDGLLYSLDGNGVPSGSDIRVFDPNTMNLVRTINLSSYANASNGGSVDSAVVRPDGDIWLNQLYSPVFLSDSSGNLLGTYACSQTSYIGDFAMAANGNLMQVDSDGHVYLYDPAMNPIRDFFGVNFPGGSAFGTFVPAPAPEPATLIALGAAALLLVRRRRSD